MTDPVTGNGSTVPVLVPEDKTPSDLTMRELDIASRKLQASVLSVTSNRAHVDWFKAMTLCTWLWAKRQDPAAKYETYADYEIDDINHALGLDVSTPEEDEGEDPTSRSDEPSDSD